MRKFDVAGGSRPGGRRLVLERFKSPRVAAALLLSVVASACSDLVTSPRGVPALPAEAAMQPLGPSFASAGSDKEKKDKAKDGYGCVMGVATPEGPQPYRTWSSTVKFPTAALAPNGAWRRWTFVVQGPDRTLARLATCSIPATEAALKVMDRLFRVPADAQVKRIGKSADVGTLGQCGTPGQPDCAADGLLVIAPPAVEDACPRGDCWPRGGEGGGDPYMPPSGGTPSGFDEEEGPFLAAAACLLGVYVTASQMLSVANGYRVASAAGKALMQAQNLFNAYRQQPIQDAATYYVLEKDVRDKHAAYRATIDALAEKMDGSYEVAFAAVIGCGGALALPTP